MSELKLYNTLTRTKECFVPNDPACITMYVCGPTVYNLAHIGNARPVVVFDCLFRLLDALYPKVMYARNITDIDDKIIQAAAERGSSIDVITREFTHKYREDMGALNALTPTIEPLATEHLAEMIALIERLLTKNSAYVSDHHVLFSVQSMQGYGALSGRKLEDMLAGARVEVADYKRHPGDFVLWKPSTNAEPGWESPWGRGRPGWHLECSAMIHAHLGDAIDIHGGGRDLIFPHHENERAQSCCGYGGNFVKYWLHNAYVDMEGEKMSKSLGNVRTVRELLKRHSGEVIRFSLLSAHYRSPLDFSAGGLDAARTQLDTFYAALRKHKDCAHDTVLAEDTSVFKALLDDINTPEAIANLHLAASRLNKAKNLDEASSAKAELLAGGRLLGILESDPETWFTEAIASGPALPSAEKIESLIKERLRARQDRDFVRADEIREQLIDQGVLLEDGPEGTVWRRRH